MHIVDHVATPGTIGFSNVSLDTISYYGAAYFTRDGYSHLSTLIGLPNLITDKMCSYLFLTLVIDAKKLLTASYVFASRKSLQARQNRFISLRSGNVRYSFIPKLFAEFRGPPGSLARIPGTLVHTVLNLHGQTFPALATASSDDITAAYRRHTGEETMFSLPFGVGRLIRSFHIFLLKIVVPKGLRSRASLEYGEAGRRDTLHGFEEMIVNGRLGVKFCGLGTRPGLSGGGSKIGD